MNKERQPGSLTPEDFTPEWIDRFWSKVDRSGICWLWTGGKSGDSYGCVCTKALPYPKPQEYSHRIAWMFTNGPIPDGLFVLHECDTPACVRPSHLFLGTQFDNMRDMTTKGRRPPSANLRLSDEDVASIRRDYAAGGVTFFELASDYDISFQHAHAIVRGKKRTGKAA